MRARRPAPAPPAAAAGGHPRLVHDLQLEPLLCCAGQGPTAQGTKHLAVLPFDVLQGGVKAQAELLVGVQLE